MGEPGISTRMRHLGICHPLEAEAAFTANLGFQETCGRSTGKVILG